MTKQIPLQKPEIMSPAGYWPQLEAAIEAGADAVYFGLKHFTARAKVGFSLTELPKVMKTLHQRGVKGYVTLNTLIFDHELADAVKTLVAIAESDADAIIIQDLGIAQLAGQIVPQLELHGSTQMSITDSEGIQLAQQLGICRVVLARELSLENIRQIRSKSNCELEMFVHGALCVSYSGQCFSSEAWGGRSANRGKCAQVCRLPYEMLVDGKVKPLADARYLLSPSDLYALDYIPEIIKLGVSALKIEGRYKDANYVALTTNAYRKAVDEAFAGLPISINPVEKLQLEQVYSRGLGPHFIRGVNHQTVVEGRSPRHRGLLVGTVTKISNQSVWIIPKPAAKISPLKAGDGVVFDAANWRSPEEKEEGGHIYHITPMEKGQLKLEFGNGEIQLERVRSGDLLWRTHDSNIDKAARLFTQTKKPVQKQPVKVQVIATENSPLTMKWTLVKKGDITIKVSSQKPLEPAQNRGLSLALLQEQLGRLGGTPYILENIEFESSENLFVPSSLLNQLRREAVAELLKQQGQSRAIEAQDPLGILTSNLAQIERTKAKKEPLAAQIHLLVRTSEQLTAALELKPASITLDYLDLYGLKPALQKIKEKGIMARVASPRILKPDEQKIISFLQRLECPILVRSIGLLSALQENSSSPLIGDFSLNAANAIAADLLLQKGLSHLTLTHDLNAAQITTLAKELGPHKLEVIVYQHLPVFHTEHCVFCRFLSKGTSYKDCGYPCEKHRVSLKDPEGRAHPVMADVGCRNTVFGAEAQEASLYLKEWQEAKIQHFRLEFVHETEKQVKEITRAFQKTLAGKMLPQKLNQQLQKSIPQGITTGSLHIPENYLKFPSLR